MPAGAHPPAPPAARERSLFDELGGETALRAIVHEFVDRVFADTMIGFFFANASRARIKDKEYEFAAQQLGADIEYSGRPLASAHRPHRIFDGQFLRRLTILRETLAAHRVPAHITAHWLDHSLALRDQIVIGACSEPPPPETDAPPEAETPANAAAPKRHR